MKKIRNCIIGGTMSLLLMTACDNDVLKYDTSVVMDFEIQLNGEPWSLNTGISTKPIFVYKENGDFFANYSSHYRFALEKGGYKFVATDIPEQMIKSPVNLNDLIIPQLITADQPVKISAAMPYSSPFENKLTMNILSRSGVLRLKSRDIAPDLSYAIIKTTVEVKRSGYKVVDETFIQQDLAVSRTKRTTTGGVNYTDDFILFQTDETANNVRIRIDFMTQDSVIVRTKEFEGSFQILPNGVTSIDFNLNDPETPIIKDYVLTINGVVATAKKSNSRQ